MKINDVMTKTNWTMLRDQKRTLLEVMKADCIRVNEREDLAGILHWIDALQDAAEEEGFPVVFLSGEERQ
jgi:hypothetical protein